jgi:phosphoribosylformylglycinamidine synthase II
MAQLALEVEVTLTKQEVEYARKHLRREPNPLEWAMIDAEWSEHCSYKSSKPYLKLLPTKGKRVILGPGYDSGIVDIGDGYVATAHIESHNHPSAIDPYGGAATGIGGVVRDILCMGTRPIAFLDSLRFGSIDKSPHSRWLFKHVVRGIADYGNCIGVPTVAGEVEFDESFEKNCLVDVVALGVGRRGDIVLAKASEHGDSVILVGGATGRDGIHGVTFASRVLTDKSEDDRSAVQIPDPFTKKLIMEATLEATSTGHVHGLKDLGGGGLTCGISEMADKGNTGIQIDISKVHLRETGLTPTEIMISESQERMVFIVGKAHEREICDVFEKYEIAYRKIGEVIRERQIVVKEREKELARIPTEFLANAPIIRRKMKKPERQVVRRPKPEKDLANILGKLLASPNIASKEWVFRQYDHEVGVRTVIKPGQGDAAVLRLPNNKFVAIKADGNSSRCYVDPYVGGANCVTEACENVVAVGAEPIAMLDHCQFGDPNNPEVFWTFVQTMKGIADACKRLSLPCIGGKVSFYNEDTETRTAIKPTPVIVVVGLIDKAKQITTSSFKKGDSVIIVGKTRRDLTGSEYYRLINALDESPQSIDLGLEKRTLSAVLESIRHGYANSCHNVSNGGLATALAEMCISGNVGAAVDLRRLQYPKLNDDELLFSESSSRFILSTKRDKNVLRFFSRRGIPAARVGEVKGDRLEIMIRKNKVSLTLQDMKDAYSKSIERLVE